jgi:SAM-dependent methyltransferase
MKKSGTDAVNRAILNQISREDPFSRLDEGDDKEFYKRERMVDHLDPLALKTVEAIIGTLITENEPVLLDLMAGWNSHIPEDLRPSKVVGLGLNEKELIANPALDEYVLHDINHTPRLPFPDGFFDAVINTVSVDYLIKPIDLFMEVGRILKPGGLFLVIFSNRMFPRKAVKIWRESGEEERVLLVEEFFRSADCFEKTFYFLSKGKPRPREDKYGRLGIPSDPVYAVYADKKGGRRSRPRPRPVINYGQSLTPEELNTRKQAIKSTLRCPHCNDRLRKWVVPDNPFVQTWDNEFMYICFNDACPYFVQGWDHMFEEGNRGISYRLMYNPVKDYCTPIPVPTPKALREGIVEEE